MARVNHNLSAMNAQRQLGITSGQKKKSAEKLASGYQINRAADDAAGLTISEKMRWQIRGLNKASRNVQDGISLIQTADGALEQVHEILQRMNELATQAANDTNTYDDRENLKSELDQLKQEINRISKTTQFNTQNILMMKQLVTIEADDYSEVIMDDKFYGMGNRTGHVYGKTVDFSNVNSKNKEELIGKQFFVTCSQSCAQTFTFKFTDQAASSIKIDTSTSSLVVDIGVKNANLNNGADIVKEIFDNVSAKQGEFINTIKNSHKNWTNMFNDTVIGHANAVDIDGGKITFYSIMNGPTYFPRMGRVWATDMLNLEEEYRLQVSERPYQEIALNLRTINSATLGVGVIDVSTFERAGELMDSVQHAIDSLSSYRSYLGAMQNRLEKTMSVVDNTAENTQSAESKLRDTDMADEMVKFSKEKILEEFGNAMLANTNQEADAVLRLLA